MWTSEAAETSPRIWNADAGEPLLIRGSCCGAPVPGGRLSTEPGGGRASGAA